MDETFKTLSDKAKAVALLMGYSGTCIEISRSTCTWFDVTIGKSIIDELIEAGIIFVFE